MRLLVIRTEKITKSFRRHTAVRNITLEVEPGEIYGILGPRGSGKTTLLNVIVGRLRPSSGNVHVLGIDPHQQKTEVRLATGYAPEKLIHRQLETAERYLSRNAANSNRDDLGQAYEIAEKFRLDLQREIKNFNKTELRLLSLVKAFMFTPELVILDEPTQDLDAVQKSILYKLIHDTRADGRTALITSQSILEMERLCDRVAVLYQGNLVAVERGVHLRSRALRHIEMRFATPVPCEEFLLIPNLNDLILEENKLRCTLQGDPDVLIKTASRYRIMDFISTQPSLEEVYQTYYGIKCCTA